MKKIILFAVSVVILFAGCKKEPVPEIIPIISAIEPNEIHYVSTDGKPHAPAYIDGFDAEYISTTYFGDYGVMYFNGPVKVIGKNAFKDAKFLKSVSFTNQLDKIDVAAFQGCENLESVEFGYSVKEIAESAFEGCKTLGNITLPADLEIIGRRAFKDCVLFQDVELGNSIKQIKDSAFFNCKNILNLVFSGNPPEFGKDALTINSLPGMYRIPFDQLESYKSKAPDLAERMLPISIPDSPEYLQNWTNYIPDKMPFLMMTIPGLHDAATWSASKNASSAIKETLKDQSLAYNEAFNHGARLFDLRLGYSVVSPGYGVLIEKFCFMHGDVGFFSELNNYKDDIPNYFPTKEDVEKSFLVLVAKEETSLWSKGLEMYAEFMYYLVNRYGPDMFINYSPDLTYSDIKGKILLFVRTKYFCDDYSKYHGTPLVKVNYLTDSTVEPYNGNQSTGDVYKVYTQDIYEVENSAEKINIISGGIAKHHSTGLLNELFVNNFNATDTTDFHKSWTISPGVNNGMANLLNNGTYDHTRLGMVYMDFYWIDRLDYDGGYKDFYGYKCAMPIIKNNFSRVSLTRN